MADDLSDVYAELRDLREQVRVLMTANPLQASSVSEGRVRFIGGLLRVDSGGRVEIVGTLQIDGTTTVTGTFKVTGPWTMQGNGTITGNVTATGTLTQTGPWNLNGAGTIAGNVVQTGNTDQKGTVTVNGGGKVIVAGGGGNVTLDSSYSSPRIQLGSAQIDGGSSSFTFTAGTTVVYILESTLRIPAMPTKTAASTGLPAGVVHADSTGKLFRIV